MNIVSSLCNFIKNQDYYISFYDNKIYINNYELILMIKDNIMQIKFTSFILEILGNNLRIIKMSKEELLIDGIMKSVSFKYE